jgi:GGDEF domain-containing protein
VAERIRASVEPNDMVARLGGDEFVVALAGVADESAAAAVAAGVQRAMAEPSGWAASRCAAPSASGSP